MDKLGKQIGHSGSIARNDNETAEYSLHNVNTARLRVVLNKNIPASNSKIENL